MVFKSNSIQIITMVRLLRFDVLALIFAAIYGVEGRRAASLQTTTTFIQGDSETRVVKIVPVSDAEVTETDVVPVAQVAEADVVKIVTCDSAKPEIATRESWDRFVRALNDFRMMLMGAKSELLKSLEAEKIIGLNTIEEHKARLEELNEKKASLTATIKLSDKIAANIKERADALQTKSETPNENTFLEELDAFLEYVAEQRATLNESVINAATKYEVEMSQYEEELSELEIEISTRVDKKKELENCADAAGELEKKAKRYDDVKQKIISTVVTDELHPIFADVENYLGKSDSTVQPMLNESEIDFHAFGASLDGLIKTLSDTESDVDGLQSAVQTNGDVLERKLYTDIGLHINAFLDSVNFQQLMMGLKFLEIRPSLHEERPSALELAEKVVDESGKRRYTKKRILRYFELADEKAGK